MKYIHYTCLQTWFKSKGMDRRATTADSISYSLKAIECELCKTLLPERIKQHGKIYDLFNFIKPEFESYMIFELIANESSTLKTYFSVNIHGKDLLRLGRGQDSDIRITDISVSRHHANIKFESNGDMFIKDNNSKFGSLVYLFNTNIKMLINHDIGIQVGRTLLRMSMHKTCSIFGCFFSKKDIKEEIGDYCTQNKACIKKEETNNFIKEIKNETSVATEISNSVIKENKSYKSMSSKKQQKSEGKIVIEHLTEDKENKITPKESESKREKNDEANSLKNQGQVEINIETNQDKHRSLNKIIENSEIFIDDNQNEEEKARSEMNEDDEIYKEQINILKNLKDKSGFIVKDTPPNSKKEIDKDELILSQLFQDDEEEDAEYGQVFIGGNLVINNDHIKDNSNTVENKEFKHLDASEVQIQLGELKKNNENNKENKVTFNENVKENTNIKGILRGKHSEVSSKSIKMQNERFDFNFFDDSEIKAEKGPFESSSNRDNENN